MMRNEIADSRRKPWILSRYSHCSKALAFSFKGFCLMSSLRARDAMLVAAAVLLCAVSASAQSSITLAWDANTEPDVTGYVLSWGTRADVFTASVDVGNRTGWTLNGLDPSQKYYFTVQAYTADRVFSDPATPVSNDGVIVQTGGVLRDGRPSLFWQNQSTGRLLTWHLSGSTVMDTRDLSISAVADTHWKIMGTGDLNGDGFSDLLWWHDAEGWLAAWLLQNNQVVTTSLLSINRMLDTAWHLKGAGDFDGDGFADLVWQHNDGRIAVWFMRGTTVIGTELLSARLSDTRFQIVGVTDIDGDRRADLIWREPSEGWLAAWTLRGTLVTSAGYLSINRVADRNWTLQTAGDVDGSGNPAIVWRHTDGSVALWYLRGLTVVGTVFTNPSRVDDTNWRIVGSR
jgi:hypothetical protein